MSACQPSYRLVETSSGSRARLCSPDGKLVLDDLGRLRRKHLRRAIRQERAAVLDLSEVQTAGQKRVRQFLSRLRDSVASCHHDGLEIRLVGLEETLHQALERALVEPLDGVEVVDRSFALSPTTRTVYSPEVLMHFTSWARDPLTAEVMDEVVKRDGGGCVWCGTELSVCDRHAELDHVIPRAHGGVDGVGNLVLSCSSCNRRRGDKDALVWLEHCLSRGRAANTSLVEAAVARAPRALPDPRLLAPWQRERLSRRADAMAEAA